VYLNERIYFHGLPKGQKLDYISKNPKVGFEVDEMLSLISQGIEEPCDINTEYNSVIVRGNAEILTDIEYKKEVLLKIVEKYTPQLSRKDIPENMVKGTAVIEITIEELTGKYYK
jgi:nitroimidazol reductase NimA-like FMN-containing flavoprotein (pyridoxamine 5'-phosphate oxidase superfamily)